MYSQLSMEWISSAVSCGRNKRLDYRRQEPELTGLAVPKAVQPLYSAVPKKPEEKHPDTDCTYQHHPGSTPDRGPHLQHALSTMQNEVFPLAC